MSIGMSYYAMGRETEVLRGSMRHQEDRKQPSVERVNEEKAYKRERKCRESDVFLRLSTQKKELKIENIRA